MAAFAAAAAEAGRRSVEEPMDILFSSLALSNGLSSHRVVVLCYDNQVQAGGHRDTLLYGAASAKDLNILT